jgi:hypothetical protein
MASTNADDPFDGEAIGFFISLQAGAATDPMSAENGTGSDGDGSVGDGPTGSWSFWT